MHLSFEWQLFLLLWGLWLAGYAVGLACDRARKRRSFEARIDRWAQQRRSYGKFNTSP